MGELIYSVEDIFEKYLESNEKEAYNIPEYQRGYKWNKGNVQLLLDDFLKFHKIYRTSNKPDQFYCLQNITICINVQNINEFNVVDGQQRLTTLLILLSYMEETELVKNRLKYSIREETDHFIKENILTRKIWKADFKPELKRKDQYYINEVAKTIKDWFDNHEELKTSKEFKKIIKEHVKLIVNNLTDNEEHIFSSLNGGKVNLDGADLIRAVLMTRASKERFGAIQTDNRINEFRVRMGMELDAINLWWGNKDIMTFFSQLLPDSILRNTQFNEKSFPINLLYMLYFESKRPDTSEPFSFKFFEYGLDGNSEPTDDHWEMYDGIKRLHQLMQEWYEDIQIYHFLGFLFFHFKQNILFREIFNLWQSQKSKTEFTKALKIKMLDQLIIPYRNDNEDQLSNKECLDNLKKNISDVNFNWFNESNRLYQILILMDLIYTTNSMSLSRIPVDYFRPSSEDKEHIRPQSPRKDSETRDSKEWKKLIGSIEYFEGKLDLLNSLEMERTLEEKEIIEIQQKLNAIGLNSIGNIVLLNLNVNRSYGNSDYGIKRTIILDNYMKEKYIRPHTLKVFIKDIKENIDFSSDYNKWTLEDIKRNTEIISDQLDKYFKTCL